MDDQRDRLAGEGRASA